MAWTSTLEISLTNDVKNAKAARARASEQMDECFGTKLYLCWLISSKMVAGQFIL
jgi:hypothetical protein